MDWSNVTYDELLTSLREVSSCCACLAHASIYRAIAQDRNTAQASQNSLLPQVDWSQPPRPFSECFSRFSFPKTQQKLQQRFKCNVYYYRSNYALILLVSFVIAFIRRPTALLSVLSIGSGVLCLNDTFATTLRYMSAWQAAFHVLMPEQTLSHTKNHLAALHRYPCCYASVTSVCTFAEHGQRHRHVCMQVIPAARQCTMQCLCSNETGAPCKPHDGMSVTVTVFIFAIAYFEPLQ